MGLEMETWISIVCIECDGHYIDIENQATGKMRSCNVKDIVLEQPVKLWNIDMQFGRAGKFINHPSRLKMNKLLYRVTCK